jgi:FMN-dependent NADH-azoreductase
MKTLLRLDASIRNGQSCSKALSAHFLDRWQELYPGSRIISRDLAVEAPPHVTAEVADAFFAAEGDKELLAMSEQLIAEWLQSDTILISTPMYNFSIPSALKAYIDHIVRVNRTFAYDETGRIKGLLQGKEVIVIVVRGGFYDVTGGEPDFHFRYLESILRFMGIDRIRKFSVQGSATPDHLKTVMPVVEAEIDQYLGGN